MSARSQRSGYQPLQSHEDESDIGDDPRPSTSLSDTNGAPSQRRAGRPGHIDLTKLDNAFKRLVSMWLYLYKLYINIREMDRIYSAES